jgi:hypothetical protein
LLFADDLPVSSCTINGLQKATDQVTKYCREWNLKCNLNKTKIIVFKEGGILKKDERWSVNYQKIEVADEINYLAVTFESNGGWKRQKLKAKQTLVAIDKCLARTPDTRVRILEIVHDSNSNCTDLSNVSSLSVLNLCTTRTWCYVYTVLGL